MNAVNRSATRSKTLHCGLNQGINLGDIKSWIGSIQFKIGFHHQDCLHTIFVYFNRRPDAFDIEILNRHGVPSLLSAKHTIAWTRSIIAEAMAGTVTSRKAGPRARRWRRSWSMVAAS